jgi:hypothetical protein
MDPRHEEHAPALGVVLLPDRQLAANRSGNAHV